MSDPETRLAAFLAKDDPPVRDIVFELEAALRLSRLRAARATLSAAPKIVIALLVAWAAAPSFAAYLAEAGDALQGWGPIAYAMLAMFAYVLVTRRLIRRS